MPGGRARGGKAAIIACHSQLMGRLTGGNPTVDSPIVASQTVAKFTAHSISEPTTAACCSRALRAAGSVWSMPFLVSFVLARVSRNRGCFPKPP